jgi:hypothetical protein
MIGYFEGIEAERGIAWGRKDSLSLRRFVGIALDEDTPDPSTISRTRRLIDLETRRRVFSWVLGRLADRGLLDGKRIGIDATTLEAGAAMRSNCRRCTTPATGQDCACCASAWICRVLPGRVHRQCGTYPTRAVPSCGKETHGARGARVRLGRRPATDAQ